MRTTIDINNEILAAAKARAESQGKSLKAVIEEALREALSDTRRQRDRIIPRVPSFPGEGVQPRVDLLDNAALEELMNADP